jgi:hypothetical protein
MVDAPTSDELVAGIDHLMIHASDADALLALFTETFALPLAFLMTEHAGAGASAGVLAGNLLLEVLPWAVFLRSDLPPGSARIVGLALVPPGPVEATLAELETRGIPHAAPVAPVPTYTNVALSRFMAGHLVFLTHVASEVLERRRLQTQSLLERDGGPVGIVGVQELGITVADGTAATGRWQRLLAPTRVTIPGQALLGMGPALHFEPGSEDRLARMVFRVKDLDRAADVLTQQDLLGNREAERVSITPERVQMLRLDFTATG